MSKNKPRKNRRNSNGKGSINYLESSNRWCASVMHGYKDADKKKPNRVTFYGQTEDEAEEKLRIFLENPEAFKKESSKKTILAIDYIKSYLEDKHGTIRDSSWDRLECAFRINIEPYLENLQLSQVQPKHIEKIQNAANKNGLSHSSIKKIYEVLRPAFKLAVKENLITENPFEQTTLLKQKDVKKKTKKKKIYTESERDILVETVNNFYNDNSSVTYRYFPIFSFIMNTGIRVGEALALTWDDLLENNDGTFILHVKHNLSRSALRNADKELTGKRKVILDNTKTDAGDREIPLNQKALKAIEQIKETKTFYNINSKFIFATPDNKPSTIGRIQKSFINLIKLADIKENYGIHSLRHGFATYLVDNKQDIKDISELMGHTDVRFTLNTYVHSNIDKKRRAVDTL